MASGLLASALETELLAELRKGVVVWLDKDGTYSGFVDDLGARAKSGQFRWPVAAFRGSFLELMIVLEAHGSGIDPAPLLVHLPGFSRESVRATPALELYEAGHPYQRALPTLLREAARGRAAPERVEAFLAAKAPSFTEAAAWLDAEASGERDPASRVLAHYDLPLAATELAKLAVDGGGALSKHLDAPGDLDSLRDWGSRQVGMDERWAAFAAGPSPGKKEVAFAFVAWVLAVEYVHDLARRPVHPALARLGDLAKPFVASCRDLAQHLRTAATALYVELADDTEELLRDELAAVRPEDLGRIDTFRAEERRLLEGTLAALREGAWQRAHGWATDRLAKSSLWLDADPSRRRAWTLAAETAALGLMLDKHPRPLDGVRSAAEGAERYAQRAAEVDRAHRRLEQEAARLLDPSLPEFVGLKDAVGAVRSAWRAWADDVARAFTEACRSGGFLPDAGFQQRRLYDEVVQPLVAGGEKVAFLLLDAFRYEMAQEVAESLRAPGAVVDLRPRLAELPTITAVGMNALAPAMQPSGKLVPAGAGNKDFKGFRTGEFTVSTPESRARAIAARAGGKVVALKLESVAEMELAELAKTVKDAHLVVVHGTALDDAGEANLGPLAFDGLLRTVRSACFQLRNAGVQQLVVSADHGFLLLDPAAQAVRFGSATTPSRRFVLDDDPRAEPGMVPVALSSLGYEGLTGYLLLREDTAAFDTGRGGGPFVHGGNSPQERVIPVLTVVRARPAGASLTTYVVEAERLAGVAGLHQVRILVRLVRGQLGFAAPRDVTLAVRPVEAPAVRAVLKDAWAPARLEGGVVRVPVEAPEPTSLFFALEGPASGRVQIELYHPDASERVTPARLEDWFEVAFRGAPSAAAAPAGGASVAWAEAIPDPGARAAFLHLQQHGAVTEAELTRILGSPRAFRRFSLAFEGYARLAPFRVRIEAGPDGKRYVKEGDR
jgi:PglZ domain-containing protein